MTLIVVALTAGVVVGTGTVAFELGRPGDVAVVGDWDCDGLRTPALYRPASGEVFEFDAWGDGVRSAPPRSTGVLGGTATVVAERSGCERLQVRGMTVSRGREG